MTSEADEILFRCNVVEESLQALVTEDFSAYQRLLTEYNILKPIADKITLSNSTKKEIENLVNEYEKEADVQEKENYRIWIDEIKQGNMNLDQTIKEALKLKREQFSLGPDIGVQKSIEFSTISYENKSGKRSKKDFSDSVKKIKKKYWNEIASSWINTMPFEFEPGKRPEAEIDDLPGFGNVAKEIILEEDQLPKDVVLNVVFEKKINKIIRELFFRKGIFLFHKASHITSAGEIHAVNGIQSWSLSSCYQGAFLGVQSILYLMGLGVGNYGSNTFLIDVWKTSSMDADGNDDITCGFIRYGYRIEHRHVWQLFKRIISSYEVRAWNSKFIDALKRIEIEDFPKQRNKIHYWGNNWIFDDLHEFLADSDFGVHIDGLETGIDSFKEKSDFTMVVALMILSLAFELINDLSNQTNLLKGERELMMRFIQDGLRHPLYQKNFNVV